MTAALSSLTVARAESIPYTQADEAHRLMTEAFARLMSLLASLHADD